MPIVYVLFRNSTERTFSFVNRLWSSAARRGRTKTPSGQGASGIQLDPYQEIRDDGGGSLPRVPGAEVTGLRSFMRNIGRSTRPAAAGQGGHSTVMLTGVSEVNDYHDHLRKGQRGGYM